MPFDLITEALGDCWLLGAIAAVVTKPELIEKLCVAASTHMGYVLCHC